MDNENAMNLTNIKTLVKDLLYSADININGESPWDIQIHNDDFYTQVFNHRSLGLGEAYMDHWWDCSRLDLFFSRVLNSKLENKIQANYQLLLKIGLAKLFNQQTKKKSLTVAKQHYDLGNDLFQYMLDKRMNYSCAYWQNSTNLDDAQRDKLELSCQKLMLKPGMRVLDIGCGFGALAKYAAENYGVSVLGVTISKNQFDYALKNCAGLPIEIRLQDYRDITEQFDRVISIGMFEHVGPKNYKDYFKVVKKSLKEDGLFLLHSIGSNISEFTTDEWIAKYIFPNGVLPSISQIGQASEGILTMEDWHNFGADYDKTLMAWHSNFNQHWPELKSNYDDRFYRMWNYYLLSCAACFRTRSIQLWQILFSYDGVPGGYQAPRLLNP